MCNFFYSHFIYTILDCMRFNSFWHFYALQIPNSAAVVWSATSFNVILGQKNVVYRPLPSSKNPHFQNEAKWKTFLLIMSFIICCNFFSFSSSESSPRDLQITATNNVLLMHTVIQLCLACLAANKILLMRERNHAFLLVAIALEWKWQIASLLKIFLKEQTQWLTDKTIVEFGYRKIAWFVSVSHVSYLPQPSPLANNWSASYWQITIFCSTSSNNC